MQQYKVALLLLLCIVSTLCQDQSTSASTFSSSASTSSVTSSSNSSSTSIKTKYVPDCNGKNPSCDGHGVVSLVWHGRSGILTHFSVSNWRDMSLLLRVTFYNVVGYRYTDKYQVRRICTNIIRRANIYFIWPRCSWQLPHQWEISHKIRAKNISEILE